MRSPRADKFFFVNYTIIRFVTGFVGKYVDRQKIEKSIQLSG